MANQRPEHSLPGLIVAPDRARFDDPGLVAELAQMLGQDGFDRLLHLWDGTPVYVPYLWAYAYTGEDWTPAADGSPRARFLTAPLGWSPYTGRACGAVWLEGGPRVMTYVEVGQLAHRDCITCAPLWAERDEEYNRLSAQSLDAVLGPPAPYLMARQAGGRELVVSLGDLGDLAQVRASAQLGLRVLTHGAQAG